MGRSASRRFGGVLGDSTASFLLRGYRFIGERCDREAANSAEVRLLLRRTTLLRGPDAARLLYDPALFVRNGALPRRARRTLTGVGGVQSLDGEEHRVRKGLFLRLLDEAAAQDVAARFIDELQHRLPAWERDGSVSVLDSCSEALCATASAWVGLPTQGQALSHRTRALRAMIESGTRLGPPTGPVGSPAESRRSNWPAGCGICAATPTPLAMTRSPPSHSMSTPTVASCRS